MNLSQHLKEHIALGLEEDIKRIARQAAHAANAGVATSSSSSGGGITSLTMGTTPITGGADTQVLFNDGGVVSSDSGFVFNKTTNVLTLDGGAVFNEAGADSDFRIEGDAEPNMFVVDAGTDHIGIGTATTDGGATVTIQPKAGQVHFALKDNGGTNRAYIGLENASDYMLGPTGTNSLFYRSTGFAQAWSVSNGATEMYLDTSGNLALGNSLASAAGAKLQVNGATSGIGQIIKLNATTPGDALQIQNSSATVLTVINASGHVGILNTSPGVPLDVTGAIRTSSTITVGSGFNSKVLLNNGATGAFVSADNGSSYIAHGAADGSVLVVDSSFNTAAVFTISATPSAGYRAAIFTRTAGTRGLIVQGAASQTANLQEWHDSSSGILSTISENGYFTTRKVAAPADAELSASELSFWFDASNGASKLKVKAKSADGTVVAGEVALA